MISLASNDAAFSDCGSRRYALSRVIEPPELVPLDGEHRAVFEPLPKNMQIGPILMIAMLNPSNAGAERNDPTIRRCMRFASDFGARVLLVGNAFPWISSSPIGVRSIWEGVKRDDDGEGALCLNDEYLREMRELADMCIVAWGAFGPQSMQRRKMRVAGLLAPAHALRVTKDGHPEHPLYLPAKVRPAPFSY